MVWNQGFKWQLTVGFRPGYPELALGLVARTGTGAWIYLFFRTEPELDPWFPFFWKTIGGVVGAALSL